MNCFFDKVRMNNESGYVEYLNLYFITIASALLYLFHGITFLLFAYSDLLVITQIISIFVCIGAFITNRALTPRIASIIMIALISLTTIIWAYSVDIGNDMRWYIILALCPLYLFSTFTKQDKIVLTSFIMLAFCSATLVCYFHDPISKMPNVALYRTVTSIVVMGSIAIEMILYTYVNAQKDNELKRIGTILDNIQCGIVIVDALTHELLDINPIATQMYEGDRDQLLGKKCHQLICPAEEGSCPITDKNQEVDRSERVLVKADGSSIPIIKSVAKVWYNNRLVLLESFTDITNLKRAEEQLRMLEITEQSNRAKSEFLSRMSHEMRTPMNAIIGMTQIAHQTNDVNKLKYCLSTIDISSSHLLGLINDILDMSKIEAGKLELDSGPVNIEKMVIKTYNILRDAIEQKDISTYVSLPKCICSPYQGDEMRISQILTNLMSNAVKFTPREGIIHLAVEEIIQRVDDSIFRFTVTDTGIGMTDEQVEKIFSAFEQADGSITRQYGGTGLGLAISKNIVEKMGGRIWAETKQNQGSSFVFEVPLGRSESVQDEITSDIAALTGLNILVVDPDKRARAHLCSIAEWYEIRVDESEYIESTISCVHSFADNNQFYDVIFIACEGIEQLDIINRLMDEIDNSTVVLMAPNRILSDIESAAQDMGCSQFISKPLFPSMLSETIKSIIAPDAETPHKIDNTYTMPDFSNLSLLLVEDIAINREIFIALMEESKVKIEVAENGMEAVQKFKDEPERYDMIIMDIQMPHMNGYEATKTIRSMDIEKAKRIPIIAMSADAFKEDVERCLDCGMNDHLKKPIEIEIVIEKLLFYHNKMPMTRK